MKAVEELRSKLKSGAVYRRSELMQWSNAVDRHIEQLQHQKVLRKLSGGLYYCAKKTVFGDASPTEHELVEAFLKDSRFLIFNPSVYNSLQVGATQLYNETVVYNHKRHGIFKLGNRKFRFVRKHHFPQHMTKEFLLVDLLNNVTKLAEDKNNVLKNASKVALSMNKNKLRNATLKYGSVRARKFFARVLDERSLLFAH